MTDERTPAPGAGPGSTGTADRIDLAIDGMHCASCVNTIAGALRSIDGVDEAEVNLAARRASVVYDPSRVAVDDLRARVESVGYQASAPGSTDDEIPEDRELRDTRRRLVVAGTLSVPLVAISMVSAWQFDGWAWVAFVLAVPVVFFAGWPFHSSAFNAARHRQVGMDTLVSVGTLAAFIWSTYVLFFVGVDEDHGSEGGAVYFETAAVIITLILLGRYFEARARRKSGEAIRALAELGAKTATLEDGSEIPVEDLTVGMRFVVRPGEKVATDGRVVDGTSAVDLSLVTGEPVPVDLQPGDEIIGASVNTSGRLVVEATRVGADTALAQIARLVDEAQSSQAPVQRLADRVSAVFVPIVMGLALAVLIVWLALGYPPSDGFTAAVAVLIIACPCALGLATPTAIMVGPGRGAQLGLIIKGGEVLESTREVDVVVLDKTGTVTEGRMELEDVIDDAPEALHRAASVEAASEHPIAQAIARGAKAALVPVDDFENLPGLGVRGTVDGVEVLVGRRDLFDAVPADLEAAATRAEGQGRTAVLVGWDGATRGVLVVADRVKATSADAIDDLHQLGLSVELLTGDNRLAAEQVGAQVGVDRVTAEVLPAQKIDEVRRLQAAGRRVAMVGDGVNDAPALAQADLGIAVGTGTDVAIQASDITVVSGDLRAVGDAIGLSRRTLATIKGNLFWAFAYNVAAIPLAAFGLLNPMIAAGAMGFSSVFVVTNSLRLRRYRSVRSA
jgi:Cu+-exporting ATPase